MDSALQQLIARVTEGLPSPTDWPLPSCRTGQTLSEWTSEVAVLRAQHDALALEAARRCPPIPESSTEVDLDVEYVSIPVAPGIRQGAKLYRPRGVRAGRPAVLLLHGGGWWMAGGSVAFELGDPFCRYLSAELDAVVLNFDYRLAPEHRFPTALDDAEAAFRWLADSAEYLGVDPRNLSLFGISSGGNLAAALARRLRNSDVSVRLHMLLVPALDLTFNSPSSAADPEWQRHGNLLRSYYVADGHDPCDPEISPALSTDFSDLPPAIVVIARFDPLRDDGLRYADGLSAAGIPCIVLDHEMTHGIATADVTARWMRGLVENAEYFIRDDDVRNT